MMFGLIRHVNVSVQPHSNFFGRNCGVNVILKQSVKESEACLWGCSAPSNSYGDNR